MHKRILRIPVLAGFFAVSLPCLGGTAPSEGRGETVQAWGGSVWTETTLDENGIVDSLTLNISMASIRGVPAMDMESVIVPLADVARQQTFFDHISLDWNPHGHEPVGIYTKPHFDIHFYHPSVKEIAALDCSVQSFIPTENVAEGYALPPDLAAPGACIPGMGIHASPVSDFAPTYDFEETFIYGYYGSELTFFEPMITQEFFLQKKSAERTLPNPLAFNALPYSLPLSYAVEYIEARELYQIRFSEFGSGFSAEDPEVVAN